VVARLKINDNVRSSITEVVSQLKINDNIHYLNKQKQFVEKGFSDDISEELAKNLRLSSNEQEKHNDETMVDNIDEIVNHILKNLNEGKELEVMKKHFLNDYCDNHNINLQEVYDWLLNNQAI
jgi:hypothetical protein